MSTQVQEKGREPNKPSQDETEQLVTLGDAIYELRSQENVASERQRISAYLSDKSSDFYEIIKSYCATNKNFMVFAGKMQKEIKGFRPQSKGYRERAAEIMIGKLCSAPTWDFGWNWYENAFVDYLREQKRELDRLLLNEKYDGEIESHALLNAVINAAPIYSVTSDDVELLYEFWYFDRLTDFDSMLARSKSVDMTIENERHIDSVELKLKNLDESVCDLTESFKRQANQQEDEKKHFGEVVAELSSRLDDTLNAVKENEQQNGFLEEEFKKATNELIEAGVKVVESEVGILKKNVATFEKNLLRVESDLADKINKNTSDLKQLETKEHSAEPQRYELGYSVEIQMPVPCQENDILPEAELTDSQLLERFEKVIDAMGLNVNSKEALINYLIIGNASVITAKSIYLVDAWISAIGWKASVCEVFISPSWTSSEKLTALIKEVLISETLHFLIIHDFQKGFIEGYLNPALRFFARCNKNKAHKKIFLVSHDNDECVTDYGLKIMNSRPSLAEPEKISKKVEFESRASVSMMLDAFPYERAAKNPFATQFWLQAVKELDAQNLDVEIENVLWLKKVVLDFIERNMTPDRKANTLLIESLSGLPGVKDEALQDVISVLSE